ncbi:MAG: sugar ABC transporter substrate-binding protein [Lachnospiraceae bacterium]|nr:sugar ABC transporter substrate-binding protein [Lachnospiraceae bacterium]
MKKKLLAVLLCSALVASMAGCGSSSSSSTSTDTTETEESTDDAEEEAEEAEDTTAETEEAKTIALVPPAMTSPYYEAVIEGATEVADTYGYTLSILAPESESDYASQVQIVEDFITQGVDAIAICAINSEAITTAVKEANEAGIPIVMFNGNAELEDCDVLSYVSYNQYDAGAMVAEWVAENVGTELKVAIVEGLPSSQSTDRMGGFVDTVEASYPDIEVVATQAGDWEREAGMNAAANMITANPDLDLIYALCDEMALGAVQAVKEANKDIQVIGFDGNPNAISSILSGELLATLSANGSRTGEQVVEVLHSYFNGEDVESNVVIEAVMVSSENADQFPAE